jgi:hypothetical protein
MSRITISISDHRHRALKEIATRSGKTIGQIVEESLEFYGVKTSRQAADIVQQARQRAAMDEKAALDIAIDETRQVRRDT